MWRWLVLAACLGGCDVGKGVGAVSGTLYIQQCDPRLIGGGIGLASEGKSLGTPEAPEPFDLAPTFFVAEPVNDLPRTRPMNRVSIRLQRTGNQIEEADVLYLNVADVRAVAEQLGQPIAVGPATNVRASLQLNQTCPREAVLMELDGTLMFQSFGDATGPLPIDFRIEYGDRLQASFSFDVVDRRAIALGGVGGVPVVPAVGGHLDGNFDFIVRQGRVAQSYP